MPSQRNIKRWQEHSIVVLSKTLFRRHGFDSDLAVALAYWIRKGEVVTHRDSRYIARWPNHPDDALPTIPDAEVREAFRQYQRVLGRGPWPEHRKDTA